MGLRPLPQATFAWIKDALRWNAAESGKPEQVFLQYMLELDTLIRALSVGNLGAITALIPVAVPNNANAAAAGVKLGQLYRDTADPCKVYMRTV